MSGDYACTFVSENLNSIMGYAPWEMRDDKKFWVKRLHPEDANRLFAELDRLVGVGHGAIEYRFRHREGHYIWIQDTFTVSQDKDGKPKEIVGSWADVSDRKRVEAELKKLAEQVEMRNRFIRKPSDATSPMRWWIRCSSPRPGCEWAARSASSP